jgi:hypothetical protein
MGVVFCAMTAFSMVKRGTLRNTDGDQEVIPKLRWRSAYRMQILIIIIICLIVIVTATAIGQ